MEEQIQSHIKQFIRKLKGDKKMKHRKQNPDSGVLTSRSNISRAMQGHIPKIPDFLAMWNQNNENQTDLEYELALSTQSASHSALQQVEPTSSTTQGKRTSDRNRRRPLYYGFDNSSSDLTNAAPPKRPCQAGDVENFQPARESVVETVQNIAVQQPEEINIPPNIAEVSPPALRVLPLIAQDTPTLARSMTVFFVG